MSNSKFKTVVLRDVELFWAKLDKPVDPFGAGPAWEVQIRTSDEAKANEWNSHGLNVKKIAENGKDYWKVGLKRKAKNRAGDDNPAPEVMSADPNVTVDPKKIGNGSKGHVRLFQYDYNVGGRSGVASQFNAIKITDLVNYSGSEGDDIDF